MKKSITLIIFISIICSVSVFAQKDSIPNSDFESWIDYSFPVYSDPLDWNNANSLTAPFGVVTVEKDTSHFDGNYSVKLSSKTVVIPFIGPRDIPGLITLANMNLLTYQITGGVPFTIRPYSFKGYYKYSPTGNDSCLMASFLLKFLPVKGKYDTLGVAQFRGGAASDWTEFEAVFNYSVHQDNPDTMNIIMLSSGDTSNIHLNSTLWVDKLFMEMSSGIAIDINPRLKTKLYPNPAKSYINLEFEEAVENAELIIYNNSGAEVYKQDCCFGRKYTVNTKSFKAGSYYFHLMLGNQRISSGSFIVTK